VRCSPIREIAGTSELSVRNVNLRSSATVLPSKGPAEKLRPGVPCPGAECGRWANAGPKKLALCGAQASPGLLMALRKRVPVPNLRSARAKAASKVGNFVSLRYVRRGALGDRQHTKIRLPSSEKGNNPNFMGGGGRLLEPYSLCAVLA